MLGIDIGYRCIKLVALRKRRGCWRLQACVAYDIAHDVSYASGRDSARALQTALQLLPAGIKRRLPPVGIALPVAELQVKTIELPSGLGHDQLEHALSMEFEPALVSDAEKICLDYRCSGGRVQAVACRQSLMDGALATLAAAGIVPALAGADVMLIADTLPAQLRDGELNLYIDAGATGIRLHSMRGGAPVYSRSHLLPNGSGSDTDPAAWLLLLRRAIQQYRMSDMLSRPDAIILYGGAAALPGVPELLQQSFESPVRSIDPFAAWQIDDANQIVMRTGLPASAFTLACALARQDASCV